MNYKVSIGAEVRTGDIDKDLKKYDGKVNITANKESLISSIDAAIKGYKPPHPIEVKSKLNTEGIKKAIQNYKTDRLKAITVKSDLDTDGIDNKIETYTPAKPIKIDVELSRASINEQIRQYNQDKAGQKIIVDAKLNDGAIEDAIKNYQAEKKIPIDIAPNFEAAEKLLDGYTARTPLKVNVKLLKQSINDDVAAWNKATNLTTVILDAKIKNGALSGALDEYKTKHPNQCKIPIDLELGKHTELDNKLDSYKKSKDGTYIPVRLEPAKDFDSLITKKPINVKAKLEPEGIDTVIENFKASKKINVGVKLDSKDVNAQVTEIPKPTELINVDVKLDEESVNTSIALFQPKATLGVKPDLILEDVDDQIRAYVSKEKIRVNVLLDNDNADANAGNQIDRKPIEVNVKLNNKSINDEIKAFKTNAKIKVGVKLDFASHKNENGDYIQNGIAKQIKDYQGKTKLRVGIQLDDSDIATQISQINTNTPVLLGVQLDPTGVQNVRSEIDNLRQELVSLGNVNINIGGGGRGGNGGANGGGTGAGSGAGGNGNGGGSGGNGGGGRGGGTRQVNESTEAYRRLMRVLRELATLRKQLSGLNTIEKPDLANSLIAQIQTLEQQYTNMMDSIRQRQIQFTNDQQSQMRTLIDSTNRKIERNQSKVDDDAAAENRARAYDRMLSTLEQIHSVEQNIAKLRNQGGNDGQISELETQLTNLMNTYQGLLDIMERDMSPEQWSALDAEITKAEQAMALLQSRFEDTRNKLAGGIEDGLNLGDFDSKVKEINSSFGRLSNQSDDAKQAVADLNTALADMKNAKGNTEALIAAHERYLEALKKSKNLIKMQQIDDKDFADTYKDDAAELQAVADKIDKIKVSLAKLKVGDNSNEITFLTNELKTLEATYQSLRTKLNGKLSPEQLAELARSAMDTAQKLGLVENQLQDLQNKAAKKIQIKFNDGDFNVLPKLNSEMKQLSGTYPELEAGIREVESAIKAMQSALDDGSGTVNVENLISAHERYEHALKNVKNQLKIAKTLEQDSASDQKLADERLEFQAQIDAWLRKNSAAADKFGDKMLYIKEQVENCDRQTLDHLKSEFKQLDMEAEAAGLKTQSFADKIKAQFIKYSAYFSVAEVIMYATQAVKDMFEQVKSIDSAMTELKKVTDETDESYNQFLNKAASRAKELGTTIDGLVNSTADFARLGYSFEESQGLAEVANVYAVVGDDIESVEDATQSLVSTLAAFRHEIGDMSNDEFAMSIVDKMNEVANNYAISSGGLGEALQRSASSMAAANNTLDETIALITAANEVAQNPEKVGNAFKTMSMRIRGAKTQLEEMGESTDGMAESTASLREEMLALSGVDIMLNENTFKSTYQIMDELSHKWEDLSDIAQATIIELVAGKHQGNVFSSLMANFDTARAALDTSINSSGSAMAEHAKWSESLEARLNKLKAAWQSMSQSFLKSDFLKGALDAAISFIDTLDGIIDKLGSLSPILGAVAGGLSLFKNDGLFTFDKKANSIKLFNAELSNMGKTYASLSSAISNYNFLVSQQNSLGEQQSLVSRLLSGDLKKQNANMVKPNELLKQQSKLEEQQLQLARTQANFNKNIAQSDASLARYFSSLKGGKASVAGYVASLVGAKVATVALQVVTVALNAALTMGVSFAITAIIKGLDEWIETADELSDRVDEITSKYKEQHKALTDMKGDYDTSSEDSMISKYARLSKGIDGLGRNVSLTADEYSEYQNIVNDIAGQIPSMVSGYDSQGNAILSCADNVEQLVKAYENLIHVQNQDILNNAGDINDDFDNAVKDAEYKTSGWNDWKWTKELGFGDAKLSYDTAKTYEAILNASDSVAEFKNSVYSHLYQGTMSTLGDLDIKDIRALSDLLEKAGFEQDASAESDMSHVERAFAENKTAIKNILDNHYADLETEIEGKKSIAQAALSEAFDISDSEYYGMNDTMKNVAEQVVSGLDYEFFKNLKESGVSVETYVNNMLNQLSALGDNDVSSIETALNLKTQFNGGEIPYGEYVKGIKDAGNLVNDLNVNDEVKSQIRLALNTEQVEEDYNALRKRLETTGFAKDAEKFLSNLTASEYAVAIDLIVNGGLDLSQFDFDIEALRAYIESEANIQDALNFKADISVDTAALETFNTALSESASATGLTSESISALESKYKKLEGYDYAKLFEDTANGVKVNREEVSRLEKDYNDLQKTKTQEHLNTLVDEYNRLTEEIDKNSNAAERARLFAERDTYGSKIRELAQYQAQLDGVTGAYQRWIDAQNTSEDYEGYEAVANGWKTVKDEISRGLLGNASKEYIDLLSGKDLQGTDFDSYVEAWNALDDKVTSTGYSVKDFFTLDDEGNITAAGIHRFFESIETDIDGIYDKTTGIYDFSAENIQAIQDEYKMGADAIGLLLEAAVAAGYNVDWGGILDGLDLATSDFETLLEYAEAVQKAFNNLEIDGVGDIDFNFKTTSVEDATSELEKAQSIYNDIINSDGDVNINASGAEEMRVMLTTLLVQKQQLEDSNIAINVDTSGLSESQQDIANAINTVKDFREKYKNLEIAVTTGEGIEEAKTALGTTLGEMQKLGDDGIDIAAKLILGEDSNGEALKGKVDAALALVGENNNIPVGFKLDETELGSLNSQLLTNFTKDATVKWINNTSDPEEYAATKKEASGKVKWDNDDSLIVEFQNTNHDAFGTVYWDDNTVNLQTTYTGKGIVYWDTSEATGTAHANGSASGMAFSRGNWGIKGSGTALGGELGQELIVRDGKFFTVGDNGAEFFNYKPNDIIFNAAQTESLLKYGGIRGAKPRGTMLATGTAFAGGSYPSSGKAFWKASALDSDFASNRISSVKTKTTTNNNSVETNTEVNYSAKASESNTTKKRTDKSNTNSTKNKNKDKDKDKDEFEETLDWVETKISRAERAIDKLDKKVNNVYKSWSSRNKALNDEISAVGDEIELQNDAYEEYMDAANDVGLDSKWAKKVRNGKVDIETIEDETLAEKIKEYQQWYEKALACKDAVEDLKETESALYAQRFENVQAQYEGILQGYEHTEAMLNEYISQAEEQGYIVSKKYYNALIKNEESNIAELKEEQADLIASRDEAVASGKIKKGSEEWYNMCAEIDSVTQAIEKGETSLLEYAKSMEETDWSIFDLIQERISAITEEADFLVELMSNEKLFDDDGKLTSQGLATMALHGQNYNTYMHQADDYGVEIADIDAQIAEDPYDQELINRRNKLLSLQRESILAAEEEKNAIRDMVEEGINLELDALQERIDKYNESIDAAKDLYDYQKNVQKQSEEIASLEKQRAAYLGNDSEEGKAKLQEIEVSLKEAKENLQETEYDKYISDQQALLDTLYNEYELILNQRLDNVDALLEQVIDSINTAASADGTIATALGSEGALAIAVSNNATSVKDTLTSEAKNVGTTLSTAMNNIWSTGDGNAKSVLTMYGEDFKAKSTTIITTLNGIKTSVLTMVNDTNKDAKVKVEENKTDTSAKKDPTKTSKGIGGAGKKKGGNGKAEVNDKVKFVSGKYYYDSQGTKPLGSKNKGKEVYITNINTKSWATHPYHISTGKKLGSGDLGWVKLSQLSGYATGKKDFLNDEIAWTQEQGKEFIVRPSDGAILTPVAKGDSILNATASGNIWDMANSPAEFIKDNLNLGATSVPNNSNVHSSYVQHFENITFSMPNVHGYNELLSEMQKDPKFEKLILSMSIDRIAGKSSLAKGKSIR